MKINDFKKFKLYVCNQNLNSETTCNIEYLINSIFLKRRLQMSKKIKVDSELQGITHLIIDATIGVTDIVEAMHKQVVHPPLLPSTRIQKLISTIARVTFKTIRWNTKFIGNSISKFLKQLTPLVGKIKDSEKKEIILSILNGVIGDHLEKKRNPLELNMEFRYQSKTLQIDSKNFKKKHPKITGKIILMIHGSCMSSLQWTRNNYNHGEILAQELDKTLIYLNYNSGKHISTSGKNLNESLEELIENWPIPVEELTIISHSMGGLVTRSALYYAEQTKKEWTKYLKKVVFLGTPHHGSPIEKIGNYLDVLLESIPYAKPFAKLGKVRSAGITDLRYGNITDEDWKNKNRFELKGDQRQVIKLPKNIDFYSVAAILDNKTSKILGDSLVDLKSALGQHKDADKNLDFKKENTFVLYQNNHLDLLNNHEITEKLKVWLT